MNSDILFYTISILAVLMIGISKSGFGSALAVFGVPLMSMVMPPAQAAAIVLPLLILLDLFNLFHYRRRFDRKNFFILLPSAIIGVLIGTLTFQYLTDAHIRIIVLEGVIMPGNLFVTVPVGLAVGLFTGFTAFEGDGFGGASGQGCISWLHAL